MDPHWSLQVLIGGFIGFALPYFMKAIVWPFRRFRGHLLKRKWWEYHFSEQGGEFSVFESNLAIKTGYRTPLVFVEEQQGTGLIYRGRVIIERDSSQFLLIGNSVDSDHDENIVCRFHLPIKSQSDFIPGVHVSFTHSKHPYSSPLILSKQRLDIDEARSILLKIVMPSPTDTEIILISRYENHMTNGDVVSSE